MYNLIEYSDNYEDSTVSLYHFKRQEPLPNNIVLTVAGSTPFTNITLAGVLDGPNPIWKNAKIIVPLKSISSFFRSLELPLITIIRITVVGGGTDKKVAFKNCHPFVKGKIHLNDIHVDESDHLDLIMNMYNLIEYSDNYEDSTASLYHFKRQEPLPNNIVLTVAGSTPFTNITLAGVLDGPNPIWKNAKIIVLLKSISSFFRSLELPLINTKVYIELNYTKTSVISDNDGASNFKITKTELYAPVVTLKAEDNNKCNQLLDTDFKRTVYWNEYKSKIETISQVVDDHNYKITFLDTKIPGVNRLFVSAFPNAPVKNSHRQYFLPSLNINDYNVFIDGRNFHDQNISNNFKKYKELRKVMTGRGEMTLQDHY